MNSGYTTPVGQPPTGDPQERISSIPHTGLPVAPDPASVSHGRQSPFVSATSHVTTEGSIERALTMRASPVGSYREEISPSRREGQPLVISDPPSRTLSSSGEPIRYIDYPEGSGQSRQEATDENRSTVATAPSATPTIRFSALDGVISAEQSNGLHL